MLVKVFDFETTGFPPGAAIVEIGWTELFIGSGASEVGQTHSMLVNPFRANPELKMHVAAQATHHIDPSDLVGCPSPDQGLMQLTADADGFGAHNLAFDGKFFSPDKPMACTLKAARHIWPQAEKHSNQFLRYHLELEIDRDRSEPSHRAGPDSYVTAHLLKAMLDTGRSFDDIVEFYTAPALMMKMPFGKHRGTRFEDVPIDYLKWLAGTDLERDLRHTVRHHLKLRGV
jgi:exodeoxyribonuclease X